MTSLQLLLLPALVSAPIWMARGEPKGGGAEAPLPETIRFNRDVRQILSDNCFACHGPDANKRKGKLRLDLEKEAKAERPGGFPILVPGNPGKSELIYRVTAEDADEVMPPPKSERKLTSRQVALLRKWIEQGAAWEDHWAYVPPRRVDPPAVGDAPDAGKFVRNPIDRFVLRALQDAGLKPSEPADRVTLVRRLYFDLLGLPPTPEEAAAFVADTNPGACERLVDALLASPHYGERMAVYWLDVVRFADSNGYHSDEPRQVAPYRDYVIRAFNENKTFDRFVIEQLAGDLLPESTLETRVASGFNMLLQTTNEGGAQPKEYMAKYSADRVRNTSSIFMGLTMGCAECHDHKFDPLSQRDFFSMAAFFADIEERGKGNPPAYPAPTPGQKAKLAALDDRIAEARKTLDSGAAEVARLRKQRETLEKQAPRTLMTKSGKPRAIRLLARGNWMDESGPVMEPAVPGVFGKIDVGDRRPTRLDLANWLVEPEHPLTSRVFVNRVWKLFFGNGLTRPLDDFGSQGRYPTHPELLDWLAGEFVRTGWDVKRLVRLIATSGAYRQSSKPTPLLRELDPANERLARQSRFRIDAEFVRDNALAVSGLLNRKIGGPSVFPYQPAGYWKHMNFPKRTWKESTGDDLYRRGLYTWWQRMFLHPDLIAFDAPSREECTVERPRSNTPLQALVLLNDPVYVEAARVFAARVLREGSKDLDSRLDRAFRLALSRTPREEERDALAVLLENQSRKFAENPEAARKLIASGNSPVPKDLAPVELAAWTSVARAILNLHETITRY